MQLSISARHGRLGDGTREKVEAKVEKLARLFERLTAISVTVDLEREQSPSVEIQVSAEHKHDFVGAAEATTVLAALDVAMHKVEQQLRKYKEKVQNHHRPGMGTEVEPASDAEPSAS